MPCTAAACWVAAGWAIHVSEQHGAMGAAQCLPVVAGLPSALVPSACRQDANARGATTPPASIACRTRMPFTASRVWGWTRVGRQREPSACTARPSRACPVQPPAAAMAGSPPGWSGGEAPERMQAPMQPGHDSEGGRDLRAHSHMDARQPRGGVLRLPGGGPAVRLGPRFLLPR